MNEEEKDAELINTIRSEGLRVVGVKCPKCGSKAITDSSKSYDCWNCGYSW
jgi:predicted RNA-binding Zn-ribbon protein involved in translation (DUF1610 family)